VGGVGGGGFNGGGELSSEGFIQSKSSEGGGRAHGASAHGARAHGARAVLYVCEHKVSPFKHVCVCVCVCVFVCVCVCLCVSIQNWELPVGCKVLGAVTSTVDNG
jgi:hypothetical protein